MDRLGPIKSAIKSILLCGHFINFCVLCLVSCVVLCCALLLRSARFATQQTRFGYTISIHRFGRFSVRAKSIELPTQSDHKTTKHGHNCKPKPKPTHNPNATKSNPNKPLSLCSAWPLIEISLAWRVRLASQSQSRSQSQSESQCCFRPLVTVAHSNSRPNV